MNLCPTIYSKPAWRHFLPALILCSALGCGLGDYEARMDAQRKRIEILDEEDRFLYNPLDVPRTETKEAKALVWPFDVFLRLPKEFGSAVNKTYTFNAQPLIRYAGKENYFAFVAAGLIGEKKESKGKDKEKEKEKEKEKDSKPPTEWPVDTFRANVRGALVDYCFKEYKVNPGFPVLTGVNFRKISKIPFNEAGDALGAIEYDAVAFQTDNLRFDLYFHQQGNKQVAIVFQYPPAWVAEESVVKGVDWSLKTLAFDSNASSRRYALQSRRQFKR